MMKHSTCIHDSTQMWSFILNCTVNSCQYLIQQISCHSLRRQSTSVQ